MGSRLAQLQALRRLSQHAAALGAGCAGLGAAWLTVVGAPAAAAASGGENETAGGTFHNRWNAGWEAGRYSTPGTGFHRADPNIHIVTYADRLLAGSSPAGARVLVPLCGKSVDMPYLASRGAEVVGVEGASRAVREFFEENVGKTPKSRTVGEFEAHHADDLASVELLLGDFFDLEHGTAGSFDAVWDRASLVAIDPTLRERYVDTIKRCLLPGAKYLLSVVEHPPFADGRLGPPYSIPESEVRRLFAADFDIEVLPLVTLADKEVHSSGGELDEHDYLLTLKDELH
jgi:thiopurine S-methyltransferase